MQLYILFICIFIVALLYSAVGQGGGSGYIAVLVLFALSTEEIKATALMLNILVSGIAVYKFYQAGSFSWQVFLPVTISSLPFAFLGGFTTLPPLLYSVITGTALLISAFFLYRKPKKTDAEVLPISLGTSFFIGSSIGLISGATGLGGGIFLSPILLLRNWADAKHVPGISAGFIFVNSISAFSGHVTSVSSLPDYLGLLFVAALLGGIIGARFGSQRAGKAFIINTLACILVFAGMKLLFDSLSM